MGADTLLVRLKPHDPRRGHVLRRYTYQPTDTRFEVTRGWYRLDKDLAEQLRSVPQTATDPHSPLAFDVCTDEEAQRLDAEADSAHRAARATEAIRVQPAGDGAGGAPQAEPQARRQRPRE
jgi:hypothetical protein